MTRCIVHVGMYKTGTTSIQRSLHGFTNDHFVYADLGDHPNQSQAVYAILGETHPLAPAPDERKKREVVTRFQKSMAGAGSRTFFISGEGLVELSPVALRVLRDLLREHFSEIIVAAAVRAPAAFMASAFQTRIKRLRRDGPIPLYRYRGYRVTFEKFDEVFGRDNVQLWKFDPESYPGGCAVRDFCKRMNIALPEERIVRLNESLSREALGLLFMYRRVGAQLGSTTMTGPQNQQLARALQPIGNVRFRFSPAVIQPVLEKHREDIQWMEARLGQSLAETLGEHRQGDVSDETDLLTPDARAVGELLAMLGDAVPAGNRGESPEAVAQLVHALREKTELAFRRSSRRSFAHKLLDRVRMVLN